MPFLKLLTALLFVLSQLPGPARAGFIGAEGAPRPSLTRQALQEDMRRLGLSPEEAGARLAALSDAELSLLAKGPAGQGFGFILGLFVGLAAGVNGWVFFGWYWAMSPPEDAIEEEEF